MAEEKVVPYCGPGMSTPVMMPVSEVTIPDDPVIEELPEPEPKEPAEEAPAEEPEEPADAPPDEG